MSVVLTQPTPKQLMGRSSTALFTRVEHVETTWSGHEALQRTVCLPWGRCFPSMHIVGEGAAFGGNFCFAQDLISHSMSIGWPV